MPDNVLVGDTLIATDELQFVNGVAQNPTPSAPHVQRVKVQYGVDGSGTDVSGATPLPVTDAAIATALTGILAELQQKLEAGQAVALDSASLAALEGITATISGAVDLSPATLAALETITVANPTDVSAIATKTKQDDLLTAVGGPGSGAAPPSGTGLIGWLRGIYDTVRSTLTVHVDNQVDVSPLATDATLQAVAARLLLEGTSEDAATILDAIRSRLAGTLAVSAAGLPLPTGAATDAKSEAIRALLAGTLAVSAAALPLPAGAATDAKSEAIRALLAGTLAVSPTSAGDVAGTLTDGRQTVATPGSAVALRASLACKWVCVTALKTNTGQVNVGGSGVLASAGASTGSPLSAGESVTLPASNASLVFVDARVSGEGVSFTVGS